MYRVVCETCRKVISEMDKKVSEYAGASHSQCMPCYIAPRTRARTGGKLEIKELKLTCTESGFSPVSLEEVISMGADKDEVDQFVRKAQSNDWRIFYWVVGVSLDDV